MSCRFASAEDLPIFEKMLRAYLLEESETGSRMLFTRRTMDWYRTLGRSYVLGALFGSIVLAVVESEVGSQVVGFVLEGEDEGEPRLDTNLGRRAQMWIVWVDPAHRRAGAALDMLRFGCPRLVELGFETMGMGTREENSGAQALAKALGAQPTERLYFLPLKEEPNGRRL